MNSYRVSERDSVHSQCCAAVTFVKIKSMFFIPDENWGARISHSCFPSLWMLSLFHRNGIIQHAAFCVRLFSSSVWFSKLIYVVAYTFYSFYD